MLKRKLFLLIFPEDKQRRPSLLPSPAGLGEGGPIKEMVCDFFMIIFYMRLFF